jgi:hypothetical protein
MRQIDRFILHVVHNWVNPLNEAYSEKIIKSFIDKFKQEADDFDIKISDEQLKKYIERFDAVKEKLPDNERDLSQYSLSKLIKVASAYKSSEVADEEKEDDTPDVVYNDNGITIWNGAKRENCIFYGKGEKWCITNPRGQNYANYRYGSSYGFPTFYLAKNNNLSDSDKLSFVALQVLDDGNYKYTNRNNNPGMQGPYSWGQLNNEIPWLSDVPNLRSILKYIPLSNKEKITQQYANRPVSIKEWIKFPYSVKEQYLVVRSNETLFNDISNNEFVRDYLPNYKDLAEFVAKNPGIINSATLLKNLEYFSPNDRTSITTNLREKIDSGLLAGVTLPFDVKKVITRLGKWNLEPGERLYITKDGKAIVKLVFDDNTKLSVYTEDDDFNNVKITPRTSRFIAEYPDLDKVPFKNLLDLIEQGVLSPQSINKVLDVAKNDPNSATIIKDTEDGQILIDSNSLTAYLINDGNISQLPLDDERVSKILENEEDNEAFQNNVLSIFSSYQSIPAGTEKTNIKAFVDKVPYSKRIFDMSGLNRNGTNQPLVLLTSNLPSIPFFFLPANPNNVDFAYWNSAPLVYGGGIDDWRTTTNYNTVMRPSQIEAYFDYLRSTNQTFDDQTLIRILQTGNSYNDVPKNFIDSAPPISNENNFIPAVYNNTYYLVNKSDPRSSYKLGGRGNLIKANIPRATAREILNQNNIAPAPANEPAAQAVAPAAGERRRGRPAGGGAPRPQGPAGDVNMSGVLQASGLNNAFTRLPRRDYLRLNVTNARQLPVANDRGASRRNNILGNAGRVTNVFATPGGSAIYIIRLADDNVIASVVTQPGNKHYILVGADNGNLAIPLNSPSELRQVLQQRNIAENIRKMATKFYIAENPDMLDETVGMIKKLKEITIKPSVLDRYEPVEVMSQPYIDLDVSFLEDYMNEFLEEPYEYENDMEDFILQDSVELNTNTISLVNFLNYITDYNFENWFNNDFSEVKYILSLKDVSSINDYVNKKAKELSEDNPEDFDYYQTEVKDIVLRLKEQVPLFLKTVELLKGKYTAISIRLDYFNSVYSILLYNDGNNIKYIAVDKSLGYFDNRGNIQIKQKVYDKIYREYDTELDEIVIRPSLQLNIGKPKIVTRRYIKDNSDYFQYNYFYELVDLGKYYTLVPSGDEDQAFLLINKEMFDDNSDDDMRGANDKLDFLYPPAELHPTQIEKLQNQIKQKPEFIGEIKIIPSTIGNNLFNNNTTTSHPQLYNFVKLNLSRIFDAIKQDDPEHFEDYWEDEIEEGDESFRDIQNYEVNDDNYWQYVDEENKYPYGQDISIDLKDTDCRGFYISNMSPEQHNEITSGFGGHDLPGFPGLYYEYIYC